jgi:hypothetical protein
MLFVLLCRTYFELLRLEFPLHRGDFAYVHQLVRNCPTNSVAPAHDAQSKILRAMNLAAVFYWKEVKCLQRSAVTTRLLRKYGIPAELAIGVQRAPFRSHAWVEIDGAVVNDKPYLHEMYTVLERC